MGLSGRRRLEFAIMIIIVLGLASFLSIKNFKVYNVRYVSMLWPLMILLAAHGAMASKHPWLGKGLGAGVLLLFALALGQHYWNPSYAKEDLRAAANELESFVQPGTPVLVAVVADPFQHYFRGSNPIIALWPGMSSARIRSSLDGTEGDFILVSARDWEWGGEEALLAAFQDHSIENTANLQGVRIYTLHKDP